MYFSEQHEWIEVEGDVATIGITNFAQEQLGEVVYVELPEVGAAFDAGDETGVVESVKAASEIYSPLTGEIVAVNEDLNDAPEKVNDDPEGDAWFFKIKVGDPAELEDLMDKAAYEAFAKGDD